MNGRLFLPGGEVRRTPSKFAPRKSVMCVLPELGPVFGMMYSIVGAGFVTVKLTASEVPPPGVGLLTVTRQSPGLVMSAVLMSALSWVADT